MCDTRRRRNVACIPLRDLDLSGSIGCLANQNVAQLSNV